MKVQVRDLKANPFRHIDKYPINDEKVAALISSIKSTEFWDNIVGRKVNGKVEIAYGHHRLVALRKARISTVDIKVKPYSDEIMLKMMAAENMEEWGTRFTTEMETVRAVVDAYADGKIKLKTPSKDLAKAQIRYAPSTLQGVQSSGAPASTPYTALSVAEFLSWGQRRVSTCLQALELIERGILRESHFRDQGNEQANVTIRESSKALRDAQLRQKELEKRVSDAKAIGNKRIAKEAQVALGKINPKARASRAGEAVSTALRSGAGTRDANRIAAAALPAIKTSELPPQLSVWVAEFSKDVTKLLRSDDLGRRFKEIDRAQEHLTNGQFWRVKDALNNLSERAREMADGLIEEE